MYSVVKSIYADFAHIVSGHLGACAGAHGHTWKFELKLSSNELDETGFVVDFSKVRKLILQPVHDLLDHGFVVDQKTYDASKDDLEKLSTVFQQNRVDNHGTEKAQSCATKIKLKSGLVPYIVDTALIQMDSFKVIVFPYPPTSERLALWLYSHATRTLRDGEKCQTVNVEYARVYETLHPVETYAEFSN